MTDPLPQYCLRNRARITQVVCWFTLRRNIILRIDRDKNNAALHDRCMCCLKSLHYAPDPFTLTSLSTYLIVASPTKNAGSPWGANASKKSTAVFHWARCHRIAQQSWVTAFYRLQFAPAAWKLLPTRLPTLPRSCSGVQSSWSYCNACTASDSRMSVG